MFDQNQVWIVGNLGKDPEDKSGSTTSGEERSITVVSVATTRKKRNEEEDTTWHRVVFFGWSAGDAMRRLSKGSRIAVLGSLHTRSWEQSGERRFITEVWASGFELIERPPRRDSGASTATRSDAQQQRDRPSRQRPPRQQQMPDTGGEHEFDDDIPF